MGPLRIFLLGLALALAAPCRAEWIIQMATPRIVAGEALEIDLILLNDAKSPLPDGMPVRLPADLHSDSMSTTLTLEAVAPPPELSAPLPSGMFRKQRYRARIPDDFAGAFRLTIERAPTAGAAVMVEGRTKAEKTASAEERREANIRVDTVPEPVLSPYEPMYIVFGVSGADTARFQFSFKYRLFDERGALERMLPGVSKLHFGYTQTSLWDIGGSSAPFRDTSYKPSLFYYEPQLLASADNRFLMGLQAGLEHESNGRDGLRSRSINIAYVQPSWRWFIDDEHYFSVAPKIYNYLEREDNNDIGKYRGHADLELRYGKRDGWLFSSILRKGDGLGHSMQLDASYPLRQPFFANAGGYVHFQYFNGYGETLLDYNVRRSPQFRIGFSIVR